MVIVTGRDDQRRFLVFIYIVETQQFNENRDDYGLVDRRIGV